MAKILVVDDEVMINDMIKRNRSGIRWKRSVTDDRRA